MVASLSLHWSVPTCFVKEHRSSANQPATCPFPIGLFFTSAAGLPGNYLYWFEIFNNLKKVKIQKYIDFAIDFLIEFLGSSGVELCADIPFDKKGCHKRKRRERRKGKGRGKDKDKRTKKVKDRKRKRQKEKEKEEEKEDEKEEEKEKEQEKDKEGKGRGRGKGQKKRKRKQARFARKSKCHDGF